MAAFPTIYHDAGSTRAHTPTVGELESTLAFDPTIRSQFESGYTATRARFTRMTRRWTVKYTGATRTGKELIRAFEETCRAGSLLFQWTDPESGTIYNARFLEPVTYTPWANSHYLYWDISFTIEQV
jgi:phage-related protein